MAPLPRFPGRVDEFGILRLSNRDAFGGYLVTMAGKDVDVAVTEHEDDRSVEANAYLWGVVYFHMAKDTGETPMAIHEAMKQRFLSREEVELKNWQTNECEHYTVVGSTRTTVSDFFAFVENVRAFAGEWLGLYIPDPDKDWRQKRKAKP